MGKQDLHIFVKQINLNQSDDISENELIDVML